MAKPKTLCTMQNCKNDHLAKGYCIKHYGRYKRYGDPNYVKNIYGAGSTRHQLYPTWANMKGRCCNEMNDDYYNYGGRGIEVCDRWSEPLYGFINFLADMGERPEGMTLDRINNDGDYGPSNCRWATTREQLCNTRINRKHIGVQKLPSGRYSSVIYIRGASTHLGVFNTEKQAGQVYKKAFELIQECPDIEVDILKEKIR